MAPMSGFDANVDPRNGRAFRHITRNAQPRGQFDGSSSSRPQGPERLPHRWSVVWLALLRSSRDVAGVQEREVDDLVERHRATESDGSFVARRLELRTSTVANIGNAN